MRRAIVAILGVGVLALLVARYARELADLALRLPLILLDQAGEVARGLQGVLQQLATDAGPLFAPLGDALGGFLADPSGKLGDVVGAGRDLLVALAIGTRDALSDWWAWASAHPETVIVVLFWAFVGIGAVAWLRRRSARDGRPGRRRAGR